MQAATIDLTAFCGTEEGRYDLGRPWTVGDYTYATDGHAAVRVAACMPIDIDREPHKTPKIEKLPVWPADGEQLDFQPLPTIDVNGLELCKRCDGKKETKRVTCTDCDGDGKFCYTSPNGHEYESECKCCDGIGSVYEEYAKLRPCDDCKRTGWSLSLRSDEDEHATVIGGRRYHSVQLLRFSHLPGVKCCVRRNGELLLQFDGGYGALMPLTKEAPRVGRR